MQNSATLSTSLCRLPASELALLIRSQKVSPVEVVKAHLARIETLNPTLNAFADLNADQAIQEARRAEAAIIRGAAEGSLLGVPVTIKSCIDVQGLHCAAGARFRSGYIAAVDSTLVARLKRAGAIVMGNTTTPELLMAYHTENELQGRTNNPWDLGKTPGGSSGGEATAISSCMSPAGFGSDGGGSIRVPAHFTGICGLKPTPGRVPAHGHYPACSGPFSFIGAVGPMARTIKDLKLLFAATAGYDPSDPASSPIPFEGLDREPARKLRIGYYEDDGEALPTPATAVAVRTAAAFLGDAGYEVEPFFPKGLSKARELWFTIFVQASAILLDLIVQGHEEQINKNTRNVLALAASYMELTGSRLLHTLIERDQLRLQLQAQMQDFPVLLAPVCSTPAFPHGDGGWGPNHIVDYLRTMTYCQHYNLLGNPAATVPVGQSPEGLPIGVQIIGRPYEDNTVLAVAEVLNEQFKWREPPLSAAIP